MLSALKTNLFGFATRTRYRKEIISLLVLKVIGLFALWYLFFSHPTDHSLTRDQLTARYLTTN